MRRAPAALLASAVLAGACATSVDLSGPAGPLTGVCPDSVVIQSDWYPQVELGALYELLGDGPHRIDAERGVVSGRLVVDGIDQGVVLELRSGGPAVEFADVARLVHEDPEVLLGVVTSDQQLRLAHRYPTVGVLTLLERDPLMIMWDPATYDVDRIADLPPGTEISLFGPGLFVDHLVDAGVVEASQLTYHHTGRPERFVESAGVFAQQGFAADPYLYERLVEDWGRPVRFQLVDETGWRPYAGVVAATAEVIEEQGDCLEDLVPMLQAAMVAFAQDPDGTVRLLRSLLSRYEAGFQYSHDQALWSVEKLRFLGVVADSPSGVAGGFDRERVERWLDRASGLLGRGQDLGVDDLVTDRFLDPGIALGADRG